MEIVQGISGYRLYILGNNNISWRNGVPGCLHGSAPVDLCYAGLFSLDGNTNWPVKAVYYAQ